MKIYRAKRAGKGGRVRPSREDPPGPSLGNPEGGFIMLGVIHRDPRGPELLDRWLATIEPQVITLEFTKYGARFRKEMGPRYVRRIEEAYNKLKKGNVPCYDNALSMVRSYVEMPYEFQCASRYGAEQGVPVRLIDMDLFLLSQAEGDGKADEYRQPGNDSRHGHR